VTHSGTRSSDGQHRQGRTPPPGPDGMDALLKACGINLTPSQLTHLWTYHQLLRQHDDELNLTRIRNFENMVVKLYADSILPALHAPIPSPLLDLGTGPGMPGIPLKIFRPDLRILLAESRQHRSDFLKTVVSAMNLRGLEVVERGIAPDYQRPVAGVITRAVEPIAATLARVAGCLIKDGMVLFMKGPRCDQEIEKASKNFASDYELTGDIPYQIPHTPHRRRLVLFRRKIDPIQSSVASDHTSSRYRVKIIESENNAIFKNLKKLLGGRGVKKQGKTLVCGPRLVAEVIKRSPERCLAWISAGNHHPPPTEAPCNQEWIQLAPNLFQVLDAFGTKRPIVLFDCPAPEAWRPEEDLPTGCSLLVPFQDPENVGAIVRTAVAFDVNQIILLAQSANPFHPKAVRSSAGTVFSARMFHGPSLAEIPQDMPVIALAASGQPLAETSFPPSFCLLTGMEGPGLPPDWQARTVAIPMAPEVESLNATVATAIALYEWRRSL
jgi:16S rRNA (guanine(527)-N(7))-methyltransferase RsmG